MKNNVYVLGSINRDISIKVNRFPINGETIHGYDYLESTGGKGGNQAAACSKLGLETIMFGAVGEDNNGVSALSDLKNNGVNLEHIKKSKKATGSAIIIRYDDDNRIILNKGANFDIDSDYVNRVFENVSGGIFLAQLETSKEIVEYALKMAKDKNLITILNPAPADKLNSDIYQYIDYLILNQSETKILTGSFPKDEESCILASKYLFSLGLKAVVITMGSKGSYYLDEKNIIYLKSYSIKPIDTTAAGDSFIGGFIYGLSNKLSIEETMKVANACGAIACTKLGALNSIPTIDDVRKFLGGKK